jgi:hypothetical protein
MSFVDSVVRGETKVAEHSLMIVRQLIKDLKDSPFVTIFLGGKNAQMMIEFVDAMGYYVSCFGKGENEEWLACDMKLPTERVNVTISGQSVDVPRHILVPPETALEIVATFYEDGTRSSTHCWIRSLDVMQD